MSDIFSFITQLTSNKHQINQNISKFYFYISGTYMSKPPNGHRPTTNGTRSPLNWATRPTKTETRRLHNEAPRSPLRHRSHPQQIQQKNETSHREKGTTPTTNIIHQLSHRANPPINKPNRRDRSIPLYPCTYCNHHQLYITSIINNTNWTTSKNKSISTKNKLLSTKIIRYIPQIQHKIHQTNKITHQNPNNLTLGNTPIIYPCTQYHNSSEHINQIQHNGEKLRWNKTTKSQIKISIEKTRKSHNVEWNLIYLWETDYL